MRAVVPVFIFLILFVLLKLHIYRLNCPYLVSDKGYTNENIKNCAKEHRNEVISPNYGSYNALPQSIGLKNNSSPYPYAGSHVESAIPSLVTQHIDHIDLDDADFGPSSKTTSSIHQQDEYPIKSNHNEPYKASLHDANKKFSTNGINNWTRFVTVSNQNNLNIKTEISSGDTEKGTYQKNVIEQLAKSEFPGKALPEGVSNRFENHQKEVEPDVVQVSVPSKQQFNTPLIGSDEEETLPNDSNGINPSLPDVMVISSSVLIEKQTYEKDLINQNDTLEANQINNSGSDVCVNGNEILSNKDSKETICDSLNVNNFSYATDPSRENDDVKSSLESDTSTMSTNSSTVPGNGDYFHSLDMSSDAAGNCVNQLQPKKINNVEDVTEVEIHPTNPSSSNEPVGFAKDNVSDTELNKYYEELEQLEDDKDENASSNSKLSDEHRTNTEEDRVMQEAQQNCIDDLKSSSDKNNIEPEGSMKRHIDQIDGFIYNTGARPKKSLLYSDKVNQKHENVSSNESLDKMDNLRETKSNQSSDIKVANSAKEDSLLNERLNNTIVR